MDFIKITKIFSEDYYAIPDYQRDYEWTDAQNATLIDDIFALMGEDNNSNHFFGALVTIPYEEGNGTTKTIEFDEYGIENSSIKHVVDGQQRLTSFSILVSVVEKMVLDDDTVSERYKNAVEKQLEKITIGDDFKGDFAAPKLVLNGNTGKCFNNYVIGVSEETYSKKYKGAKRIEAAYKCFEDAIYQRMEETINKEGENDKKYNTNEEFYRKLVDTIRLKVVFVVIECDESSDAFQVFDSLNGKGLDLTAADRIKNIFMSWSTNKKGVEKWDGLVSAVGEDYLVNFFVAMFFFHTDNRVPKNKLPDKFKEQYRVSASEDWNYFYNTLKEDGVLYGKLRKNKTESDDLNGVLEDFDALNFDQIYVMLFAVAKYYDGDTLESDEYYSFAKTLLKLVVRMQVCEKSMNKLDTIFGQCINKMKNENASITVITKALSDEMMKIADNASFKTSFTYFSPADNKVGEYYLRCLEDYLRTENDNRDGVKRGLTVEHIIPQEYDLDSWYGGEEVPEEVAYDFKESVVENIGNKLLLYGDDNSSAGNGTYEEKVEVYRNGKRGQDQGTPVGTFELVKKLLENNEEKFIHTDVTNRAKRLAEIALKIWS